MGAKKDRHLSDKGDEKGERKGREIKKKKKKKGVTTTHNPLYKLDEYSFS